ncbi:ALA-interacting subunit 1 [Linum perenne]
MFASPLFTMFLYIISYSNFSQQDLPACKPILTPGLVIATFTFVGIVFIPIGLASISASENVVEVVDRYDEDCIPSSFGDNAINYIQNSKTNKTCSRTLMIPKPMKQPIYIYYQLDNFYQNYRRIEEDLEANEQIEVAIENNYNSYGYGGKKTLVLSTTTWIGGRNDFLGIAYLAIGGICLLLAISFILIYVFKSR